MSYENEKDLTPDSGAEPVVDAEGLEDTGQDEGQESPEGGDELEALKTELEKTQAQASEYLDGWQRARAEFANFKKRTEAEREDIRCRSNEELLLRLLPVVDDFERAFQSVPPELADEAWVNGVAMVLHKLESLLENQNVIPVESVGQAFDPQRHEAIMQEESTEHPDGTVIEELLKGYCLGDRVLRPSIVKVASNPEG